MLDNSQLIFAATESKIYAKEFDPILESTRSDIPPLSYICNVFIIYQL